MRPHLGGGGGRGGIRLQGIDEIEENSTNFGLLTIRDEKMEC